MANEITIVVKGENRSRPAFKEPADDADKLKTKLSGTDAVLLKLMADFNRTGEGASKFGRTLMDDGQFGAFLEQQMVVLQGETRKLGEEFERTGNIDIYKKIKDNQASSSAMSKIKNDLERALGDGGSKGGEQASRNFIDKLGNGANSLVQGIANIPWAGIIFKPIASAMESLPPQLQAVIAATVVTAIVGASAMIGAALNGVLLTAIGLGGITAGIIGQIHNPAVGAAFKGLLYDVEKDWVHATSSFAQPLVFAAHIFAGTWHQVLGSIGDDIAGLSLYVAPVAEGIQRLFSNMGPGLASALEAAGPMLMAFSQELPGLGSALSSMFQSLSNGSTGAVEGLRTLFWIVDKSIIGVGNLISFLSQLYEGFLHVGQVLTGWASHIPLFGIWAGKIHDIYTSLIDGSDKTQGKMLQLGAIAGDTAVDFDALAGQISKVTNNASTLAAAMTQKVFSATMGVDQATLGWHSALTNLSDTLHQNGLAIDKHTHLIAENTKNGEQNRSAILAAVQANMAQYQANIAVGMSAQAAAGAYDNNTRALEDQMRQAHYTQAQIDDLIGKYRGIPDTVNTNIAMQGLTDAINGLSDLIARVNGLDGRHVNMTVDVWQSDHTQGIAGGRDNPLGFHEGHGRATGGIVSGMTWVGEHGPELVKLPSGSQVYSHGDSERMAGAATSSSGGGDSGSRTVNFVGDTDRAFARFFAQLVRDRLVVIN